GPTPEDARAWRLDLPPARRDALGAYRMAAWLDDPAFPVDDEVRGVLEAAVAALRRSGVAVGDRARPDLDFAAPIATYHQLLFPIVLAYMPDEGFENLVRMADAMPADDPSPLARSARYPTIRHRDWLHADERRTKIQTRFAALFRDVDVLLMPVVS